MHQNVREVLDLILRQENFKLILLFLYSLKGEFRYRNNFFYYIRLNLFLLRYINSYSLTWD